MKNMKDDIEKKIEKPVFDDANYKKKKIKKRLFWLIIILFVVLVIPFTPKLISEFNDLSGKDIVIKVDSNKQDFFLKNGEQENVSFKISLRGNSLCTAKCSHKFLDISTNQSVKKENFTLGALSQTVSFALSPKHLGKGQELYRLDLVCQGRYTALCHTSQRESSIKILVTLQHNLNDEENIIKDNSILKLTAFNDKVNNWHTNLDSFIVLLNEMNKSTYVDKLLNETSVLEENLKDIDKNIVKLQKLWKEQDLFALETEITSSQSLFESYGKNFSRINEKIDENVSRYNELVFKVNSVISMLDEMRTAIILNLTNFSRGQEVNQTINEFNAALIILEQKNYLEIKEQSILPVLQKTTELYSDFKSQTFGIIVKPNPMPEKDYTEINKTKLTKIEIIQIPFSNHITFEKPAEQCCIKNECEDCCLSGICQEENLPILFVHGHDFSKYAPAEYNLDIQSKIQERLEEENFIDAGSIYIDSKIDYPGVWGNANVPITLRSSYYFGLKNESGQYILVQTKEENITEYATRLKQLIDIIKYKTGKPKVVIVAYSMGGLVSRRYLQLFGEQDVDKLILFATPNQGIEGEISSACPLIGGKKECEDMNVNSTFMKELSQAPKIQISVYAIIGTGCTMLQGKGDGIVLEKNARLEGAKTFVVKGDCSEGFLHTKINDPDLYPQAYGIIEEILKGET
ncbi:MAG: alpha/beta fold hydrolase [Candidatus Pacearchaeota archaeon]|nr:alpha/beta fold hydrolase [Candidatus Pacearchaeota archaeon]